MKKILILILLLLACGTLFAKEYKIPNDDDIEIGTLKKEGWEVTVYEGTFPKNSVLIIEEVDIPNCPVEGKQIDIKLKGHEDEFVHFYKPIKLTFKMNDTDRPQDHLFGYYDPDKKFHCYIPDRVELKEDYMVYYINHFTGWFGGKSEKEEAIDTMVNEVARENWIKEKNQNDVKAKTSKYLDKMFKEMKITDAASRSKLVADFFSMMEGEETKGFIDFAAQNINNLKNGDFDSMGDATVKYVSETLLRVMRKDTNIATIPANLFGNLSSAAGYLAGGDKDEALKEIGKAMRNCDATTQFCSQLADIGREKAENLVTYIAQNELEDAYYLYTGHGVKWRLLDNLEGDIDGCMDYLGIGSGISNSKIIDSYAKQLNKDPIKDRDFLINKSRQDLKKYFESRKEAEKYINKQKPALRELVKYMDEKHLLDRYGQDYFEDYKKFDLKFRLKRLFNIRETILSYIDPLERKYIEPEEMAGLIKKYVEYVGDGERSEFFQYLIDLGYCKKAKGFEAKKKSFGDKLDEWVDDLDKWASSLGGDKPKEKPKDKPKVEKVDNSKVTAKGCYVLDRIEIDKNNRGIIPSGNPITWKCSSEYIDATVTVTPPPKAIYPGDTITITQKINLKKKSKESIEVGLSVHSGFHGGPITYVGGDSAQNSLYSFEKSPMTAYITYRVEKKPKGYKYEDFYFYAQGGLPHYTRGDRPDGGHAWGYISYHYKWRE
ncbi:MAG: hypothetical protein IJS60_06600 [Abditibacteriota bacterium]|nr:hypothetical protein [Abditibacteriota bacterium]